jgi:NADH-quinone oxidoreductase subunit M
MIVLLGSIALPFTSGFVGEFLLINALIQYQVVLGIFGALTTILGAVYMLRAFQRSMTGDTNPATSGMKDLHSSEKMILYPVVILIVLIGIYPSALMSISEPAVNNLLMILNEYLHP